MTPFQPGILALRGTLNLILLLFLFFYYAGGGCVHGHRYPCLEDQEREWDASGNAGLSHSYAPVVWEPRSSNVPKPAPKEATCSRTTSC
jgi:hypothetical protein